MFLHGRIAQLDGFVNLNLLFVSGDNRRSFPLIFNGMSHFMKESENAVRIRGRRADEGARIAVKRCIADDDFRAVRCRRAGDFVAEYELCRQVWFLCCSDATFAYQIRSGQCRLFCCAQETKGRMHFIEFVECPIGASVADGCNAKRACDRLADFFKRCKRLARAGNALLDEDGFAAERITGDADCSRPCGAWPPFGARAQGEDDVQF